MLVQGRGGYNRCSSSARGGRWERGWTAWREIERAVNRPRRWERRILRLWRLLRISAHPEQWRKEREMRAVFCAQYYGSCMQDASHMNENCLSCPAITCFREFIILYTQNKICWEWPRLSKINKSDALPHSHALYLVNPGFFNTSSWRAYLWKTAFSLSALLEPSISSPLFKDVPRMAPHIIATVLKCSWWFFRLACYHHPSYESSCGVSRHRGLHCRVAHLFDRLESVSGACYAWNKAKRCIYVLSKREYVMRHRLLSRMA